MIEIIPQQLLLPKKVYIGDAAELRCTFTISSPLSETFLSAQNFSSTEGIELPLDSFLLNPENNDIVVNKILLTKMNSSFTVNISFVPWRTGELHFPPLQIDDITLILQPVQIVSITAQNNSTSLQEPLSPLLLPGTTYKLYGALLIFILLLVVGIQIIIRHKSLSFFIKNKKLLLTYRKNKKSTYRNLRKLLNSKIQNDAATEIQKILRHYLEVRFDFPFTKSTTNELMKNFINITQNLLSDSKNEAFGEIVNVFIRTDFIRYSKNTHFLEGELSQMVNKIIMNIEIIESEEQNV